MLGNADGSVSYVNELKDNLFTYLGCLEMSQWSNHPSFHVDHKQLGTAEANFCNN